LDCRALLPRVVLDIRQLGDVERNVAQRPQLTAAFGEVKTAGIMM
jgi:hypothetical protein